MHKKVFACMVNGCSVRGIAEGMWNLSRAETGGKLVVVCPRDARVARQAAAPVVAEGASGACQGTANASSRRRSILRSSEFYHPNILENVRMKIRKSEPKFSTIVPSFGWSDENGAMKTASRTPLTRL